MNLFQLNLPSDGSLMSLEQAKLVSARLTCLTICFCNITILIQTIILDVPLILNIACIVIIASNYFSYKYIRPHNIQFVIRSLLAFLTTASLVLSIFYPNAIIGIYLAPILLQAIYSEDDHRWRIVFLVIIALCFHLTHIINSEAIPFWFNDSYDYMTIVEINCIISGFTCALIAGINRDLNLQVNQTAKLHSQRLKEEVQTVESARNELAIVSERLIHSKKDLDIQIAIEEQNQMRLNQAHEQLEQFSLAASHDLKEPIRTIRLYTQLVQKRLPSTLKEDSALQEHFQFITSSCKHMYSVLEKLLIYQKASYSEGKIIELSVNKLWQQQILRAATEFRTNCRAEQTIDDVKISFLDQFIQSIALKRSINDQPWDPKVDTIRMTLKNAESLFYEIARNAILFRTWDSEIQIDIEVTRTQNHTVKIVISDNGIGISKPYWEKVFGMFKRIHPRESYPGTGLGLPIARRIVTLADGTIKIESSEGQGTNTILELPTS